MNSSHEQQERKNKPAWIPSQEPPLSRNWCKTSYSLSTKKSPVVWMNTRLVKSLRPSPLKTEESSVAVTDHPFLSATELTSSIPLGMLYIIALVDYINL